MDRVPDRQSPELEKVINRLREKPVKVMVISFDGQQEKPKDIASGDNLVVITNDGKPETGIVSTLVLIEEGIESKPIVELHVV